MRGPNTLPLIWQMRAMIKSQYPGEKWAKRVAKMKDNQVQAIWHRMVRDGQIKW